MFQLLSDFPKQTTRCKGRTETKEERNKSHLQITQAKQNKQSKKKKKKKMQNQKLQKNDNEKQNEEFFFGRFLAK